MIAGQPVGDTMVASLCIPYVLGESYTLNTLQSRIHGLDHWWRVWKNAQLIGGPEVGADMVVVSLFCLFHDSMRFNDQDDPGHGIRGFRLWERYNHLEDVKQYLTASQIELFFEACAEHDQGQISTNPTIAVCWDSDRLDLARVGIWPDTQYMSTQEARALCMNRIH